MVVNKFNIVEPDDNLYKLISVVSKATQEFIIKKGILPNRVFLNDKDFNLKGEVEICGYKVFTSPYIPTGQAVVVDKEVVLRGIMNEVYI